MKILVVGDEMKISEKICLILKDSEYKVCGRAVDFDEAIVLLKREKPDLAILDINLKGSKDGIEVAKRINKSARIPFIYTSSPSDTTTVVRVKSTNPSAFLLKPFEKEQLFEAIVIAMDNFIVMENERPEEQLPIFNDAVFVKSSNFFTKVPIEKILFIQKSERLIALHTKEKIHILRATMSGFVNKLASEKMIRIHRSYVVNVDMITDVASTFVSLGKIKVPLAKKYTDDLLSCCKYFN
ncbi:MAG: response regulator [Saprospiraceae bacterium]